MGMENPIRQNKKRVHELEKKRGSGRDRSPSPLSPDEEREYIQKRRKGKIWENNQRKKKN